MQNIVKKCVASASELIQHSELYMTVKAVLFTTPSANLNGVRCTEAFIDNIIANQEAYVGLPLSADIQSLENGQYNKLGHMFDQTTGTFATAIIGSFYKFEKELLPNGEKALVGYARIMKRNRAVCSAVGELFASGNLKFSFEICCGEYTQLEDGTMLIDVAESNYLEGMCIVWSPACPVAVAKELVAELNNDRKEADIAMNEEAKAAEITAEEIIAEEEKPEETNVEEVQVEKVVETAAENIDVESEAVIAEDENTKSDETQCAEENKSEDSTDVSAEAELAEEENAEEQSEDASEENAEEENAACGKKKCGEEEANDEVAVELKSEIDLKEFMTQMQQISEAINDLKREIAELKESKTKEVAAEEVVAEVSTDDNQTEIVDNETASKSDADGVNPFIAEISLPENHKYSLLEKVEKPNAYSLLEKY